LINKGNCGAIGCLKEKDIDECKRERLKNILLFEQFRSDIAELRNECIEQIKVGLDAFL
jgi:ATP-dependent Lon protease